MEDKKKANKKTALIILSLFVAGIVFYNLYEDQRRKDAYREIQQRQREYNNRNNTAAQQQYGGAQNQNSSMTDWELQRQDEGVVNGWNGNTNSTGTYVGRGRSAYEIQLDLKKAYSLLEDMERQYRECTVRTSAAQYPYMISKQQELIRRLEDELRRASY